MNLETVKSGMKAASCFTEESIHLKCPVGKIWESIKEFDWAKLCPSLIKSCKFTSGNPLQLGSTYKLELKDGNSFTYSIVEISELERKITMEMIECEPKQNFSSLLTSIKCCKVSEDNTSVLNWETIFSNDVSQDILKKRKDTILSYFKDFKKLES
jgi:hypothetical protein